MATAKTTDSNFEKDVLTSDIPVLVDFWAEWCAPCRAISTALEEIAAEFKGRLKVVKLNIDENPKAPDQYGVRGIPYLLIFQNGQIRAEKIGAASKAQLQAWVEESL